MLFVGPDKKLKFFEFFFGPKHIYFCSDFITKTALLAVSHLYHAPYKRLIYSRVSKTLHFSPVTELVVPEP